MNKIALSLLIIALASTTITAEVQPVAKAMTVSTGVEPEANKDINLEHHHDHKGDPKECARDIISEIGSLVGIVKSIISHNAIKVIQNGIHLIQGLGGLRHECRHVAKQAFVEFIKIEVKEELVKCFTDVHTLLNDVKTINPLKILNIRRDARIIREVVGDAKDVYKHCVQFIDEIKHIHL